MKGLKTAILTTFALVFTFLLCCTILGWESITNEKKEFTQTDITSTYNTAYTAGQDSKQDEINQLEKSLNNKINQISTLQQSNSDKANQIIKLENSNYTLESENEDLKQQITDLEERLSGTVEYFIVSFYNNDQSRLFKTESIKDGESILCPTNYQEWTSVICENCNGSDTHNSVAKWKMYIKNNAGEYVFFNEIELNSKIVITADTMFIAVDSWKYHDCQYA